MSKSITSYPEAVRILRSLFSFMEWTDLEIIALINEIKKLNVVEDFVDFKERRRAVKK